MSDGSKTIFCPNPWHTGQAPFGELKEKCCGVGVSNERPVAGEYIRVECRVSVHGSVGRSGA